MKKGVIMNMTKRTQGSFADHRMLHKETSEEQWTRGHVNIKEGMLVASNTKCGMQAIRTGH